MSRVDELIEELAVEGVKYVPIGEAMTVLTTARGIKRGEYSNGSLIPIVDQGQSHIAGYTDDRSRAVQKGEYIVFGEHTRAIKWVDFEFAAGADGTKVLIATDGIMPKFAYYALSNLDIPSRGYNRHWTVLRELKIPIPPLEVQREVVTILDQFSELKAKLEIELKAELEARRRQYEHYRLSLMRFDGEVEWVSLGDIATIGTGSHDTKDAVLDGEYVFYARGRQPLRLDSFDFDERAIITAGDGVGVGKVFHFTSGRYALHQRAYRIVPKEGVDARYIYHYLVADFSRYLERTSVHASVTSLRRPMFLRYPVPLPPLPEQLRISSMLDKLNELVNDLSSGLPAELAARRKQYEYYRDRLLTFEEATA